MIPELEAWPARKGKTRSRTSIGTMTMQGHPCKRMQRSGTTLQWEEAPAPKGEG